MLDNFYAENTMLSQNETKFYPINQLIKIFFKKL
jgi:hypothetical protein